MAVRVAGASRGAVPVRGRRIARRARRLWRGCSSGGLLQGDGWGLRKKVARLSHRRRACQWMRATTPRVSAGKAQSGAQRGARRRAERRGRRQRGGQHALAVAPVVDLDAAAAAGLRSKRKRYSPATGKKGETWNTLRADHAVFGGTIGRWSGMRDQVVVAFAEGVVHLGQHGAQMARRGHGRTRS